MAEASSQFVFLEELQEKIGVCNGDDRAAGDITLGACACLTGADQEKIRGLPDLTGMKSEVPIQKRRDVARGAFSFGTSAIREHKSGIPRVLELFGDSFGAFAHHCRALVYSR